MHALKTHILADRSQDEEITPIQHCVVFILVAVGEGRGYLTSRNKENNLIEFELYVKCIRMNIF